MSLIYTTSTQPISSTQNGDLLSNISQVFGSSSAQSGSFGSLLSGGLGLLGVGASAGPIGLVAGGLLSLTGLGTQISTMFSMGGDLTCLSIQHQAFTQKEVDGAMKEMTDKFNAVKDSNDISQIVDFINWLSLDTTYMRDYRYSTLSSKCSKAFCKQIYEAQQKFLDSVLQKIPNISFVNKTENFHNMTVTYKYYSASNYQSSQNMQIPTQQQTINEAQNILQNPALVSQFANQYGFTQEDAVVKLNAIIDGNFHIGSNGEIIWGVSATNQQPTNWTNIALIGGGAYLLTKLLTKKH